MNFWIPLEHLEADDLDRVGGKAMTLGRLFGHGFRVPKTICLTTRAYNRFVETTGLRGRILLELQRKDFRQMRWEEVWDAALRIRGMFHATPYPSGMERTLREGIETVFGKDAVAVRSSAPGEDSKRASFAGLHESFVNLLGADAILVHIKLVWASLWSDAALMYRQELGLDFETSAMAVIVQETIPGERSGVAFGRNPADEFQGVVEAVYGLNQGLVDGVIEPDRWMVDRTSAMPLSHTAVPRTRQVVSAVRNVDIVPLPADLAQQPPLSSDEVSEVFRTVLKLEEIFGVPQDLEWTLKKGDLYVLQSRPITTLERGGTEDERQWYLSLHRSFENLKELRRKIENELIPEMIRIDQQLSRTDIKKLSDRALSQEIDSRAALNDHWVKTYWNDFIPYAHGIRLFGQVYNDAMKPENPFEFVDLLAATSMASLDRNRRLEEMAAIVRTHSSREASLRNLKGEKVLEIDQRLGPAMESFIEMYGDLTCPVTGGRQCTQGTDALVRLVLELAAREPAEPKRSFEKIDGLKEKFLSRFTGAQGEQAAELLDLARSSYRLRDDDNIHLGRIEAHLYEAVGEARRRLKLSVRPDENPETERILAAQIKTYESMEKTPAAGAKAQVRGRVKARQILGQPAGEGLAKGRARVIRENADLIDFKNGEILVCDAVDPNMTFVVPLASGIVERRGGMLIHGAIIAREYGLPCVTGVPDATRRIHTGDRVTVDGFLGIVTIE